MRGWLAIALFIIMTFSLQLAACGGSNNMPSVSQVLSGVAAAGTPITGTVYLEDSSVPAKQISAQINTDGSYSLDVTGLTAPFLLAASGTVNRQSCTLYSLAGAPGITNVNPLTNLAVFQVMKYAGAQGQTRHTDLFNQFTNVISQIQTLLQPILTQYGVATTNFASDPYTANHAGLDLLFDMVDIYLDIQNGTLTITNKINGASIFNTIPSGDTLNGQVVAANIPAVPNQKMGAVNVYPANKTIAAGESASFTSIVVGRIDQAVTWSVVEPGGGSITASGLYLAPATPGKYHIKATSASDSTYSDVVTVTAYLMTEYAIPTANSQPTALISGPDGNIWFTEQVNGKIGKITTAGVFTEYAISTIYSQPTAITSGPDGNLWFTERGGNKIGKITTAGVITEYPVSRNVQPLAILSGPDGNIWFTEENDIKIGKITTAGVITEYAISSINNHPNAIISGPDGNIWFTADYKMIGKITTAGVSTVYAVPTPGSGISTIVSGPDGNIWFTEQNVNKIGKITPGGVITEYVLPRSGTYPNAIISGPDGNLWFTGALGNHIGKITTSGVITEYAVSMGNIHADPSTLVSGTEGNIWYAVQGGNSIGKITTTGVFHEYVIPNKNLFPSSPSAILSGSDGNIWFAERYGNKIGIIME